MCLEKLLELEPYPIPTPPPPEGQIIPAVTFVQHLIHYVSPIKSALHCKYYYPVIGLNS